MSPLLLASAVVMWRVVSMLCFFHGFSHVRVRLGAIEVVILRTIRKNLEAHP